MEDTYDYVAAYTGYMTDHMQQARMWMRMIEEEAAKPPYESDFVRDLDRKAQNERFRELERAERMISHYKNLIKSFKYWSTRPYVD